MGIPTALRLGKFLICTIHSMCGEAQAHLHLQQEMSNASSHSVINCSQKKKNGEIGNPWCYEPIVKWDLAVVVADVKVSPILAKQK